MQCFLAPRKTGLQIAMIHLLSIFLSAHMHFHQLPWPFTISMESIFLLDLIWLHRIHFVLGMIASIVSFFKGEFHFHKKNLGWWYGFNSRVKLMVTK
jgi:hypothetical protein